jgi:hypothetical protein
MTDTRTEVSNQIIASGSNGLTYVVLEYTEYRSKAAAKDIPETWVAGVKSFTLHDGTPVKLVSAGEYEIQVPLFVCAYHRKRAIHHGSHKLAHQCLLGDSKHG